VKPLAEDIAVIGLACLFPGAPDVAAFWRNIVGKVDAISDPPPEAWDASVFYDQQGGENDRVYCRKGGYLGPLAQFDPIDHGIMPRAVEGGEPDQWLALHVARQALRDAGYEDLSAYRERAALILGKGTYANRGTLSMVQHAMIVDYTLDILKSVQPGLTDEDLRLVRTDLKRRLPRFDAETAPALIPNVVVGRIANRLDLMGPSYTIDAACASSLVALDIAVKGLRQGEYDIALAGGLQVATPHPVLSLFCRLNALSRSERIRPFDKDADGTLLSEGLGMAVLKRRSDAERDGNRIYAVVKGAGVASDGRAVSVLAPRVDGEELAIRRAYDQAAVAPNTVGLIEAHGTGTLVGDAVEVEALARVFGERVRAPHCALGSVKSMIGHTMPAAGMAGFIKAVLALYHKVLPPTINVDEPSPRLGLERTPFYINTETRPWIHAASSPRRAGINSFGFGGINAHVVVEEVGSSGREMTLDTRWDSEVCLFAGEHRAEVAAHARQVLEALRRHPAVPIADVARALNLRPQPKGVTLGIVAQTTDDLVRKLERAISRLDDRSCRQIKETSGTYYFEHPLAASGMLAFLFPGEGSQYVNMLADLCRYFPAVRGCFDQVDRIFAHHSRGYVLSQFLYPPPALPGQRTDGRGLFQMDIAVEAVLAANHALHALLTELGIRPDVLVGHSTGEYSALRAAGMLGDGDEERTLELNRLHRAAVDGDRDPTPVDLIAIGAARERVAALCSPVSGEVALAMDNCPHQVIIAVQRAASAAVQARCRAEGLLYEVLPFDRPYHTAMFDDFAQGMREFFARWITRPGSTPLYSCTTMDRYPARLEDIRRIALEHWIRPVEFRRTIEQMYADGVRLFVEVGPRGNLTAFVEDILSRREYAAIPVNVARRTGITQLHHLLAQLSAHGIRPTLEPLYARRGLGTFEWTTAARPAATKRPLGPVKIPTGASEMSLSPEVIERIRRRGAPVATPAPAPAPAPAATPASMPVELPDVQVSRAELVASPAPATMPGDVVTAFFGTMGRFLSLEEEFMSAARAGATPEPADTAAWPFIDEVLSVQHGESLVARCRIDIETYPFLRDHTLGRDISTADAALTGFPIVPFTALMEMMAEAASALSPGRVLVGMSDVRVHRWAAVDEGPLTLELHADRIDSTNTRVRILDQAVLELGPIAEGVMRLGDRYPDSPAVGTFALEGEAPFTIPPDRLYETAMFHGPAFRGVRAIDGVGAAGARATLEVLEPHTLLAPGHTGPFVTDFVLLDQPGQVVGFWAAQRFDSRFFVLPTRIRSLELYGSAPAPGTRLACHARIATEGEQELRSTLDIVGADGRLWARFEGWDDRRFDLPPIAHQLLLHPATASLSDRWPAADEAGSEVVSFRIGLDAFPAGWLNEHGGLWRRVIAALVLGAEERAIWRSSKMPAARRLEWLLGRIAAKDAVRDYLRRRYSLDLCPADIQILPDATGRPVVHCCLAAPRRAPIVSISHVAGAAIAIAGDGQALSGIGVDLERCGRMKPDMEQVAFSAAERDMLRQFDADRRPGWSMRFWCAKEAFAKSTACSVGPASRALTVENVDVDDGTVLLRYTPEDGASVTRPVATAEDGDWVVATCLGADAAETTEGARL
jgi:acyl transferase domain-containing protein/phosphopantetheinyl transferase (holo-ACP synthase)